MGMPIQSGVQLVFGGHGGCVPQTSASVTQTERVTAGSCPGPLTILRVTTFFQCPDGRFQRREVFANARQRSMQRVMVPLDDVEAELLARRRDGVGPVHDDPYRRGSMVTGSSSGRRAPLRRRRTGTRS